MKVKHGSSAGQLLLVGRLIEGQSTWVYRVTKYWTRHSVRFIVISKTWSSLLMFKTLQPGVCSRFHTLISTPPSTECYDLRCLSIIVFRTFYRMPVCKCMHHAFNSRSHMCIVPGRISRLNVFHLFLLRRCRPSKNQYNTFITGAERTSRGVRPRTVLSVSDAWLQLLVRASVHSWVTCIDADILLFPSCPAVITTSPLSYVQVYFWHMRDFAQRLSSNAKKTV
jgi:hypothetical protein